jgi:hypothetical protein
MPKESNIVHRYLRKKSDSSTVLLRINPIRLSGLKLTLIPGQEAQLHEVDFKETLWDDLKDEGFEEANPLEFNLYYSGLAQ